MSVKTLLIGSVVLIGAFGALSFLVAKKRRRKERMKQATEMLKGEHPMKDDLPEKLSFREWFMGRDSWKISPKSFMLGMASGLVFGFVDNFGLFYGMDSLDEVIKTKAPGGKYPLLQAGWGNTFSDAIGAFLGTFAGKLITDFSYVQGWTSEDDEEYPLISEAIGIVAGCMLGIAIPYAMKKGTRLANGTICGLGL